MSAAGTVRMKLGEESSSAPADRSGAYLAVGLVCAVALGVALVMWRTTVTLLSEWSNTDNLTYTHGYLIVAVSGWSIFRSRGLLASTGIAPSPFMIAAVVAASIVWLVAYQAALLVVHQALLPATMWLAVFAVCGWPIARRTWFAFGYLYFAIPVWSLLNAILQNATTAAMKAMLPMFAIPTYFSGNTVHIPAGVFEIAGGCSGLHFFVVGLALAALYGEIHRDTLRVRVLLIVLAAFLAVLANWIRVFTIIAAGHLTNMEHFLVKVDHYYFGWVVFALAMALFFFLAARVPAPAPVAGSDASNEHGSAIPKRIWLIAALTCIATALGPIRAAQAVSSEQAVRDDVSLPDVASGWRAASTQDRYWRPRFARADALIQGKYDRLGNEVQVSLALYRDQRQGKEFAGPGTSVLGDGMETKTPRRPLGNGFGERIVTDPDGTHWLLWDTYLVGTRQFYSGLSGQLWYGLSSIWGPKGSAVLALRTRCLEDCARAHQMNKEFVQTSAIVEHALR